MPLRFPTALSNVMTITLVVAACIYNISNSRRSIINAVGGTSSSEPRRRNDNEETDSGGGGEVGSARNRRRLEFVHITKTGGSAIEKAAAEAGVRWGACHFEGNIEFCHGLNAGPDTPRNESVVSPPGGLIGSSPWHTPPAILESQAKYFLGNPYEGADLFTVVRNPYSRAMSEYYCPWEGKKHDDPDVMNNPDVMNRWLHERLGKQSPGELKRQLDVFKRYGNGDRWIIGQKHLIPQVMYVFDGDSERVIPEGNTLHFENLAYEFHELIERYDLEGRIRLPATELTNAGKRKRLSYFDLYPETIRLINNFYQEDFEAFGYDQVDAFGSNWTKIHYQESAREKY